MDKHAAEGPTDTLMDEQVAELRFDGWLNSQNDPIIACVLFSCLSLLLEEWLK